MTTLGHDSTHPAGELSVPVQLPANTVSDLAAAPPAGRPDSSAELKDRLAWRRRVQSVLAAVDLAAVGAAVIVAYLVRIVAQDEQSANPWYYPGLALVVLGAWMASLAIVRAYEPRLLGIGSEEFRRLVMSAFVVFGLIAVVGYTTQYLVPRAFVAIALPLGLLLLCVGRLRVRKWIQRSRMAGRLQHRVVVVGNHWTAHTLAEQVRREPYAGFTIVGACLPRKEVQHPDAGLPVLGTLDRTLEAVRRVGADTVAVTASPEITPELLRQIAWSLEGSGVDLIVAPSVTDVAGPRISVRPVAGLSLLYVDEPTFSGVTRVVKRGIDLVVSAAGLLVLGLPMLVMGACIRLTSSGPALFRQTRVGRDGHEFAMWKFRSMYRDAESRWAELMGHNENDGLLFKVTDDPRVTPLGRVLRRTSLDELPQLVNVLRGDMSLVGPRPLAVDDSEMEGHVRRRLLVRPGMTGMWQVSGRKDVSWDEAVRLDLYYVENWSLSLDFTILMRTFLAVWRGEGAC